MKRFGLGKQDRQEAEQRVGEQPYNDVECPHTVLVARWNALSDMGDPSKISSYTCDSCHRSFSPQEGERIMAQQAQRLHIDEIEEARAAAEAEGLSEEEPN